MPYTQDGIGFQNTDTSKAAAATGGKLRARDAMQNYFEAWPELKFSPEQLSARLEIPECTIKPRLTELKNDGIIQDSGKRGETKWGKPCILWELVK